jgi:hypothetical protein
MQQKEGENEMLKGIQINKLVALPLLLAVLSLPFSANASTLLYKKFGTFTSGSGVLGGNHCEATVTINPATPPLVNEIVIEGAEAPVLTFRPIEYLIEGPLTVMSAPAGVAQQVISDGTKEWWRAYNYDWNGSTWEPGDWTIYLDEPPTGCSLYNNHVRFRVAIP